MDIVNLSREAKKLRRWFEVFQHAEEVLQAEAIADERLRGLNAAQAEAEANLERVKEQGTVILTKAQDEQTRVLERAEEEGKAILAKARKEVESILGAVQIQKHDLLTEMIGLKKDLSDLAKQVNLEKSQLATELASAQSKYGAMLEELVGKEHMAREATKVAEEKLRVAREALADLKANL